MNHIYHPQFDQLARIGLGSDTDGMPGFANLDVEYDAFQKALWSYMRPENGKGSFTLDLLRDMRALQRLLTEYQESALPRLSPRYFVSASRIPGIYNLGGDLELFVEEIRSQNRESVRRYAHACIDVVYNNHIAFDLPLITIALIQGDALGGGFECALSYDVIVAERGAKIGLPEILFNLFPGMGAYSFLSRRVGATQAERIILSGRLYRAEELHEMGAIDVLANDGDGEAAVRDYIQQHDRKHNAHRAVYDVRRRVNAVTEQELRDVVEIWVDAAMNITEPDLKKMTRLAMAQNRRIATANPYLRTAAE